MSSFHRVPMLCLFGAFTLLSIAGCGGGGGSGASGSGSGSGRSSVVVAETSKAVTTHHDHLLESNLSIPFTLTRIPDSGIGVLVETDSELVSHAQFEDTDPSAGILRLSLVPGTTAGVGEHPVNVLMSFCYDEACSRHINGSPINVAITYDVRSEDRKVRVEITDPAPAHALLSDDEGPLATAVIRVFNPPAEGIRLSATGGYPVVRGSTLIAISEGYEARFQLDNPGSLGLGDHTSETRLDACFGSECSKGRLLGHPRIGVDYTVTNIRIQDVRIAQPRADDMIWDPWSEKIILAAQSYSTMVSATRGLLDPYTGIGEFDPSWGGLTIDKLALSPDGQWLYASAGAGWTLVRYRREDLVQDLQTTVRSQPDDPSSTSLFIKDLQFGPDGALAMLTSTEHTRVGSHYGADLRLIDGTSTRAQRLVAEPAPVLAGFCSFTWSDDGSEIYLAAGRQGLLQVPVETAGVGSATVVKPDLPCFERMQAGSGRLFFGNGLVINPADGLAVKRVGIEPGQTGEVNDVVLDQGQRRVYVLHTLTVDQPGDSRITVHDLDSLDRLDSVLLRDAKLPNQMIRWGERGIALRNPNGEILLIEGGVAESDR